MAALRELKVVVKKATPVEDHSTFRYHIALQYGETTWEVTKRFSEFDALLQSLGASRYSGLPTLPSKTLMGSPTDVAAIEGRKEQLRIMLNDLVMRPDTRTSQPLRQFLALDSHVPVGIKSLQPDAMRTFEDPRFGVSGLSAAPAANLLLITHEDSTHLSRLGRVWSVVEPDELGALHLWAQGSDSAWKRIYSRTYGIKVRSLCWEDTTRQFFVGLEDGKIEVHSERDFMQRQSESLQHSPLAVLELHHKSPVTHLSATPRKLLSLGFDTAMRVIDIRTRELSCGGRLLKRLRSEMDFLTCGHLDDEGDRAFIGTSGGDMFILDVARNPPSFLHTVEMGSKPCAEIVVSTDSLLVAHCECISVMSLETKGNDRRTTRIGTHQAKYLLAGEVSILSICVAPEKNLVFGGFSCGSVAIWCSRQSEACIIIQAHQCDTTRLVWIPSAPWGPSLMTGGGDGKVITWSLTGDAEDYHFWSPQGIDTLDTTGVSTSFGNQFSTSATVVGDANLAIFEPSWLTGGTAGAGAGYGAGAAGDVFTPGFATGGSNPRVNPNALKREGESDSDDDIASAFR